MLDGLSVRQRRCRYRGNGCDGTALAPGDIGGNDQCGNLPGRGARSDYGFRGVATDFGCRSRGAQPLGTRLRDRLYVRRKRCVVVQVIGRMLSYKIDDRNLRATGIVQVGEAVDVYKRQ